MKSEVILSVVGSDRPGLTQALAEAILAAEGNWLDSHLSRLGGKYVGSVLVEIDDGQMPLLERVIREIDATGLHVSVVSAGEGPEPGGETLNMELVGQDRLEIVREVTSVLTRLQVNIEDFETFTEDSAWTGGRLFRANARLTVPRGMSIDTVRAALEAISGEIMVDFTISSTAG